MSKNQKYARLGDYSMQLLVPVSLLEKILQEGYLVSTKYEDNRNQIDRVREIGDITIHDQQELDVARAQQELGGE